MGVRVCVRLLPEVCADMLLQHGAESRPQVVQPAVKGVHAVAQGVATKRAHLGGKGEEPPLVTQVFQTNTSHEIRQYLINWREHEWQDERNGFRNLATVP